MKTKPKCYPNPKPIYFKFFKRFCEKCKMDFIREPGWKYTEYWAFGGISYRYLCKDCAPTQKEAYNYFNEWIKHPPQGNV